jgi:hypothetical protein
VERAETPWPPGLPETLEPAVAQRVGGDGANLPFAVDYDTGIIIDTGEYAGCNGMATMVIVPARACAGQAKPQKRCARN